jgi:hypothetical protein
LNPEQPHVVQVKSSFRPCPVAWHGQQGAEEIRPKFTIAQKPTKLLGYDPAETVVGELLWLARHRASPSTVCRLRLHTGWQAFERRLRFDDLIDPKQPLLVRS